MPVVETSPRREAHGEPASGSRRALRSLSGRHVFGDSVAGRDSGCEDWAGPWPCLCPSHFPGSASHALGTLWRCVDVRCRLQGGITHPHTRRDTGAHMHMQARHTGTLTQVCTHPHTHRNAELTCTPTCMHRNACTHACTHRNVCAYTHPRANTEVHLHTPHARTETEGGLTTAPCPCQPRLRPVHGLQSSPANEALEILREVARDSVCHVIP